MIYADRSAHWTSAVRGIMRFTYPTSTNITVKWGAGNITIDARPGWWSDPLWGNHKWYGPELECSVPELLGWKYYPRRVADLKWQKPFEKDYFAADDWATYGNPLGGLLDVVSPRVVQTSFKKEHRVDHLTLGGHAFGEDFSKPLKWPWDHPFHPVFTKIEGTTLNRHYDQVSVFIHPTFGDYRFRGSNVFGTLDNSMGSAFNIWDLLRRASSGAEFRCNVTQYNECVIRNFKFADESYEVDYEVSGLFPRRIVTFEYELEVNVRMNDPAKTLLLRDTYNVTGFFETMLRYPNSTSVPLVVGSYTIPPYVVSSSGWISYHLKQTETLTKIVDLKAWERGHGSLTTSSSNYADLMWDRTDGSRLNVRSDVPVELPTRANQMVHRWMGRLQQFTNDFSRDIRSTSLYSSADAITQLDIDSNFFESVPQLPALLSVVGLGMKTWSDLRKFLRGDFSVLSSLCHDISAAVLAYQYGVVPAKSDVENLASLIRKDLNGAIGKLQVVRGSFDYTFDREYASYVGEGSLTLKTRSKIVLNGLSPLPELLIGAGSVGFKPTLANLWDLVPFSFVADWFFNLSDRYADIDSAVLLHLVGPSYYVHSYKVVYTPSLDELTWAGLGIQSQIRAARFIRDVSRITPVPRETKIDFRAPPSLQKRLVSIGALLGVLAT